MRAIVLPIVLAAALAGVLVWRISHLLAAARSVDEADRVSRMAVGLGTGAALLVGLALAFLGRRQLLRLSRAYQRALSSLETRTQALRDSEARARAILNTAVDAIITIDTRGVIQSVNPAAERIFGYPASEMIGQNVSLLMPAPDCRQHDQYIANYLQTGIKKVIGIGREVMGRRKNGDIFPMDLAVSDVKLEDPSTGSPSTGSGQALSTSSGQVTRLFTGVARDITERKKTEEALREAKEAAENASKAKDRFVAIVSHELRTPLTPVLATVSALQEDSNLPQEFQGDLAMIRRNIEHEARLIDDLLDLTTLTLGRLQLDRRPTDVHAVLSEVLDNCRQELRGKSLRIKSDFSAGHSLLLGDAGRLRQVFWNLLRNAIKFSPTGGQITIRTANPEPGQLVVTVEDSGIGIDPQVLPHLFEPFEQGERSVNRRFGGLGLGLAIARTLTEAHQGTIHAQSRGSGQGARFMVSLPTLPVDSAAPAPSTGSGEPCRQNRPAEPDLQGSPSQVPAAASTGREPLRILLVEDHSDTLRTMSRLLRDSGYTVVAAANVHEALAAMEEREFDLLISDLGLPDGSGYDVIRRGRSNPAMRSLALSGFGMADDIRRSLDAGFDEHLTKPIDFPLLKEKIREIMAQARH